MLGDVAQQLRLQAQAQRAEFLDDRDVGFAWRNTLDRLRTCFILLAELAKGTLAVTVFQNARGQAKGAVDAAVTLARGERVDSFVWIRACTMLSLAADPGAYTESS